MRNSKFPIVVAIALVLSVNGCLLEKAEAKSISGAKVAIVDVQKIVESSPEINALKISRQKDIESLVKFAEVARTEVEKETNASKKKALEDGYNKELNIKKVNFDKDFTQKLSDYDKNVTALIDKKAKSMGYDIVLIKTSVLSGGTNITDEIIKEFK